MKTRVNAIRECGWSEPLLKTAGIILFVAGVTILHFTVSVETRPQHVYHVILRTLYLIPIIAAAIWFRLSGALITSTAICLVYGTHVILSWEGRSMENMNQIAMLIVYLVLGMVAGSLSCLEARQRKARLEAEQRKQREIIVNSLEGLSQALKYRDSYTQKHSENVADLAVEIARRMDMAPERVELLRLAARVHDIGKIGIRDDILLKPEKLSLEEKKIIEYHPIAAADILRSIAETSEIADIVLAHHERSDGSGYPQGLTREGVPPEALILSVADTYSALTEDRPYQAGMGTDRALEIMKGLRGTKLDSVAVDALVELLRDVCRTTIPDHKISEDVQ